MDREGRCRRGKMGGFRTMRKGGFVGLGGHNLLVFLGSLSSFQPSLGACHEDMGTNFIFEAIDKEFPKERISHALCSESQVLKCGNKVFHYLRLL
jgi:hypothetical protein